jgi:type III secretion system FlhB-like substrate exporter
MSEELNTSPALHVHPEVRLRIASRELLENARRIFELCENLGIDADSLTYDWSKEDIGITEEVVESAPKTLASGGGVLERLMPNAISLEYHLKKHKMLSKKVEDVTLEKESESRTWNVDGHFHWCPNCSQVFGCDAPDSLGNVRCTQCNFYGRF